MLARFRGNNAHLTLPALQGTAVALMMQSNPGWGWAAGITFLVMTGLYGWLRSVKSGRIIADTPTSRIASAAQGYVELHGRGRPLEGIPLVSPVTQLPVLWYRLVTERKQSDGKWRHVSTHESDASFLLDDGTGLCAVDPEGADMLVRRREVIHAGDYRHTQWSLINGDRIYVLGGFATLGSVSPDLDIAAQVRDLLAHWKSDRGTLLKRFDLDGDGEIDLEEWRLARSQARREVLKLRDEVLAAPEAHVVRKPDANRLYLISDLDPAALVRRHRLWSLFHLVVFLGACASAVWFHSLGVFAG